jgi:hypothetical protein
MDIMGQHPLNDWFREVVAGAVRDHVDSHGQDDVEQYLSDLLVSFLHTDSIFALRDKQGNRLVAISDMIPEGDVLANADSFERERQVHRHIGDFILFWSGMYPQFLKQLKFEFNRDLICDYDRQARESYHLVSTFDRAPFDSEAPVFRKLSEGFEDYAFCLRVVRDQCRLA